MPPWSGSGVGIEELVGNGLVEQVHAAAIERLLAVLRPRPRPCTRSRAYPRAAKVALECLEQVQIVGGLVVVDNLEEVSSRLMT